MFAHYVRIIIVFAIGEINILLLLILLLLLLLLLLLWAPWMGHAMLELPEISSGCQG